MRSRRSELYGRGLWNVWIWMGVGLLFVVLNVGGTPGPRSPYWVSEIGRKSLTEGLIFTGVLTSVLLSPLFWLSPLVLAYYTIAYSSFIALPLLFVDEELLWKKPLQAQRLSIPFFWLLGFVLALTIRVFWGLIYGPVVTQLLHLPPGP